MNPYAHKNILKLISTLLLFNQIHIAMYYEFDSHRAIRIAELSKDKNVIVWFSKDRDWDKWQVILNDFRLMSEFFSRPNYLKIGGRLIVYMWLTNL